LLAVFVVVVAAAVGAVVVVGLDPVVEVVAGFEAPNKFGVAAWVVALGAEVPAAVVGAETPLTAPKRLAFGAAEAFAVPNKLVTEVGAAEEAFAVPNRPGAAAGVVEAGVVLEAPKILGLAAGVVLPAGFERLKRPGCAGAVEAGWVVAALEAGVPGLKLKAGGAAALVPELAGVVWFRLLKRLGPPVEPPPLKIPPPPGALLEVEKMGGFDAGVEEDGSEGLGFPNRAFCWPPSPPNKGFPGSVGGGPAGVVEAPRVNLLAAGVERPEGADDVLPPRPPKRGLLAPLAPPKRLC
jgi:hypothetical protein